MLHDRLHAHGLHYRLQHVFAFELIYFPDVVYDSVLHISLNMSYESNLKFSNRNITSMNKAIVFLAVMKTNFKKKVLVKCNNTKLNRHLKSKEFIKV